MDVFFCILLLFHFGALTALLCGIFVFFQFLCFHSQLLAFCALIAAASAGYVSHEAPLLHAHAHAVHTHAVHAPVLAKVAHEEYDHHPQYHFGKHQRRDLVLIPQKS